MTNLSWLWTLHQWPSINIQPYINSMAPWKAPFDTLRLRQYCRHFAEDIFKCIFLNENVWFSLKISLKLVPKVWINNISALGKIMAWRWPGNKPLTEPMMVSSLTHICVTRPQWVYFHSLAPQMKCIFSKLISPVDILRISCEIGLR